MIDAPSSNFSYIIFIFLVHVIAILCVYSDDYMIIYIMNRLNINMNIYTLFHNYDH